MKDRCVLLQAQVIVFQVSPISRAIFPWRSHFMTGEYRVIIIIISIIIIIIITITIIIIIIIITTIAIVPNILFSIDGSMSIWLTNLPKPRKL